MPLEDFCVQVADASRPEATEEIVALFERVANEEDWQPGGEIRAHVAHSTFFGLWTMNDPVSDQNQQSVVIAGLQLVRPSRAGTLPSHKVWPELVIGDPNHVMHIAMLAVDKEWRGKAGGLFWLLTAQMWNHCVREGIRDLWLEATPRTMRCYKRMGWPLRVAGELREHWGEPCYPCSLSIREVAGVLAERAVRSTVYRRILTDMVAEEQNG